MTLVPHIWIGQNNSTRNSAMSAILLTDYDCDTKDILFAFQGSFIVFCEEADSLLNSGTQAG